MQNRGANRLLFVAVAVCTIISQLHAQACFVDVNPTVSPDIICEVGQSVNLNANVTGDPFSINWEPATLVAPTDQANTTATVFTTTTFTVTARTLSNVNLISNGDFSAGNTGFTTTYLYLPPAGPLTLYPEGTYTIASNPIDVHDMFASCSDHTGGGDMMIVNGASIANQNIWCQTVPVMSNTSYGFEAWVASVVTNSPGLLQFSINGTLLGSPYQVSPALCDWQNFVEEWNSGASTMATICIVNQNTAVTGNDFAIDDLFFGEICEDTDDVIVTLQEANSDWIPQNFCQNDSPVFLDDLLSPGATPGGFWTINSNPNTVFDPLVLGPGAFEVTYMVGSPPCVSSHTEFLAVEPVGSANWTPPDALCLSDMPNLLSDWLDPGTDPSGIWTLDGTMTTAIYDPVAWGPGPHTLTYTVGSPPCETSVTQMLNVDPLPDPTWLSPGIQCPDLDPFPLATLLAPGADPSGWWTVNGEAATIFSPITLGPGNHQVRYTVGDTTGCFAILQQNILVVTNLPPVSAFCAFNTETSVIFQWDPIPNVQNYEVEVISGPSGQVNGLFYIVNGIPSNTTVVIRVRAIGPGGCPGPWSDEIGCTSGTCVPVNLNLDGPTAACFDTLMSTLEYTVMSGLPGDGSWSGTGITDTTMGIFDPAVAGPGTHRIYYHYTEGSCMYADSIDVTLSQTPVATINGLDESCVGDTLTFSLNGMVDSSLQYNWILGSGLALSSTVAPSVSAMWQNGGSDTVRLQVTAPGCPPSESTFPVLINSPIEPPLISCQSSTSSVQFIWNNQADVAAYSVISQMGYSGTMTSDTSYLIDNLVESESVSIQLLISSNNSCPDTLTTQSCTAQVCPAVMVSIDAPDSLCYSDPNTTFSFVATVSDGSGSGVWSGAGIVDSLTGVLQPSVAGNGIHTIRYTYRVGNCVYEATKELFVQKTPEAIFTLPADLCVSDTALLSFTGMAGPGASFDWNFAGASDQVIPDDNYLLQWPVAGVFSPSLTVTENGCSSAPFSASITVAPQLELPLISCNATLDAIEFSWNQVDQASGYVPTVAGVGMSSSDTSFQVINLQPESMVSIELETISANACPGSVQTFVCNTDPCPLFGLGIDDPGAFCAGGDTLTLTLRRDGVHQTDSVVWSGLGITDAANGRWWPDPALAGSSVQIFATYTYAGLCTYQDSIDLLVPAVPVADVTLSSPACTESLVTATAPAGFTNYQWFTEGANVVGPANQSTIDLSWAAADDYLVGLVVSAGNCLSDTAFANISISGPPDSVTIECVNDLSSVTFSWSPPANFTTFVVNVLQGPNGTLLNDSTYQITGLLPEQTVEIEVQYTDAPECPPSISSAICAAAPCTSVSLSIDPLDTICLDNSVLTLPLTAQVTGDASNGSLVWSGHPALDAATGVWDIPPGLAGSSITVYYTYTEGLCSTTDSLEVYLSRQPVASFTLDSPLCTGDTLLLEFTGEASPMAVFDWQLGNDAILISAVGSLPLQVVYASGGTRNIQLVVEDAGCSDGPFAESLQVDAPLVTPQVDCAADFSSVSFSWTDVPGAVSYQLDLNDGVMATLNGNTAQVNNLQPGSSVTGSLTVVDDGVCPDVVVPVSCSSLPCPQVDVVWQAPDDLCAGDVYNIALSWDDSVVDQLELFGSLNGDPWQITASAGVSLLSGVASTDINIQLDSLRWLSAAVCGQSVPAPLTIAVSDPPEAGTSLTFDPICANENEVILFSDYLLGADPGGMWVPVSGPTPNVGSLDLSAGQFTLNDETSGTYVFAYQLPAVGGCPADESQISIELLSVPVVDAGPDQSLDCILNTLSIGSSTTSDGPGFAHLWTAASGNPLPVDDMSLIDVSSADVYTLRVEDLSTGCSEEDEVTVVNDVSFVVLAASAIPISCAGAQDGLIVINDISGGNTPYSIQLNGEPAGLINRDLAAGEYVLTVTDAGGCTAESILQIIEPAPIDVILLNDLEVDEEFHYGDELTVEVQTSVTDNQLDTIIWQPDSLNCSGCMSVTFFPTESMRIAATVVDTNGCRATDFFQLIVNRQVRVYPPNAFSPNGDGMNDEWMVFAAEEVKLIRELRIFNRWGEQLHQEKNFSPNDPAYSWDGFFRNQPLPPAVYVYWLEVELQDGEIVFLKGDITLLR